MRAPAFQAGTYFWRGLVPALRMTTRIKWCCFVHQSLSKLWLFIRTRRGRERLELADTYEGRYGNFRRRGMEGEQLCFQGTAWSELFEIVLGYGAGQSRRYHISFSIVSACRSFEHWCPAGDIPRSHSQRWAEVA